MFTKENPHRTGLEHRYRGDVTSCENALYYINFTVDRKKIILSYL